MKVQKPREFSVEYPTDRDIIHKSAISWMNGKRIDDNVGEYWRIHDKIYDLSKFMNIHPGGKFWIESTRGTDITEAFESSHLNPSVEKLLPKYYIKKADTPRNAPYTFEEDGFYKTLKRKVWPIISASGSGPTFSMLLLQDSMVVLFLVTMFSAAYYRSIFIAIISGVLLGMVLVTAHNFFHQADNFRMYYFDLSTLSSKEWRVTHGISHHLFTNTLYDFEISALEPFVNLLPNPNKSLLGRICQVFLYHVSIFFMFQFEALKRISDIIFLRRKLSPENLLPYVELFTMILVSRSFGVGFYLWFMMVSASSIWFGYINAGSHHHPEIYHAYDRFRDHPDWGLCQLDAVRDRIEITGSLFLVVTMFGDHTLHHLFPTIDHSKLPLMYPAFLETCKDFNIPFSFRRQSTLFKGTFQQILSNSPNTDTPGYKKNKEIILPAHYL